MIEEIKGRTKFELNIETVERIIENWLKDRVIGEHAVLEGIQWKESHCSFLISFKTNQTIKETQ